MLNVSLCNCSPSLSVSGQSHSSSVVVAGYNVSSPVGSKVLLQCVSGRMVWTRDRLRDRQRVVHWDMYRAHTDRSMERVLDMFSAGDQRIYNSYNRGRVSLSSEAFKDGNFSLIIKGQTVSDAHVCSQSVTGRSGSLWFRFDCLSV